MDDDPLLARQAELQRAAAAFTDDLGLLEMLGRAGRVVPLGSAVTGLMVWRDLDFGVDAPGLTSGAAWETLRPLFGRCSSLRYLMSAWQIYDAVLNQDVRTLDELDTYLAAHGFPTRTGRK